MFRAAARTTTRGYVSFYETYVERYAGMEPTKLTLRQMVDFGRSGTGNPARMIKSAQFIQDELPIRLARRLVDLRTLPYIVVKQPLIEQVYKSYHDAFDSIRMFPRVKTIEDNVRFTELLKSLVTDTSGVVHMLSEGVREARRKVPLDVLNIDDFLNKMLTSRIGRRVLAEQHVALGAHLQGKKTQAELLALRQDDRVGVIHTKLSPMEVMKNCAEGAAQACDEYYGQHPQVKFHGSTEATIPYIPVHLEYICTELFKNAMRATMEHAHAKHHMGSSRDDPNALLGMDVHAPDIHVLFAEGTSTLTMRISDCGGGISPSTLPRIWRYGFTTMEGKDDDAEGGGSSKGGGSAGSLTGNSSNMLGGGDSDGGMFGAMTGRSKDMKLAGYGFGLPLSRLYAEYYGGSIQIVSLEGYGVDAYLHLDRTGKLVESAEI